MIMEKAIVQSLVLGPSELSVIGRCRIIEEAIEQSLVSLGPSELSVIGRCRIIEEAIV